MIKLYTTAIESNSDGTSLTIFEDFNLNFKTKDDLLNASSLAEQILYKIEDVELINEQANSPF